MKVIFKEGLRLGLKRFNEGNEIDIPDKFAAMLIRGGKVEPANDKPAMKTPKKAEEEEEKPKKSYKTRHIKAEDTD